MTMCAGLAEASVYTVEIPGTVTSVDRPGDLYVGEKIYYRAQFDEHNYVLWGDTGVLVFGANSLPVSGSSYFRIDAATVTWSALNYEGPAGGGGPGVFYDDHTPGALVPVLAGPGLMFTDAGIVGIMNVWQVPGDFYGDPTIVSGSYPIGMFSSPANGFRALPGAAQAITFTNYFGFGYEQKGTGVWDYANATLFKDGVQIAGPVPEPATWAMLIVGFALVGASLRRRRGSRGLASS